MNKTFAVFANGGTMTTAQTALWQYDYGQILVVQGIELPTAYEVQFCNAGDSTTVTSVGDSTGVVIPDQFLQNGETIYAYIYLHTGNADGETEYKITIPVMDRAEPTDIEPTPAQESTIGQLIDALNAGVEAAEEAAEKGPHIIGGFWYTWDADAGEYVSTNVKAEGEDGYSPVVTITEIEGGHRVTITDEEHPQGQSFDVMDGQGGSGTSDYDDLTNKPQISSMTLSGNKSLSDLGIEPEAFIVTFTAHGGSITADHTYAEIGEAASAGKRVIGVLDGYEYQLFSARTNIYAPIEFAAAKGTFSHTITIQYGDVITYATPTIGTYSKPSGGIPASDLASAVQTSLGKADTALQTAPVTSVNGQTGAVTLSIPTTASDVGAVAANQGAANANKVLTVNSSGVVVPEDNRFVVTLTPTAQDFSGVMDKTVAEIDAAYGAGKQVFFRIYVGTDYIETNVTSGGSGSGGYPSFNGFFITNAPYDAAVNLWTGTVASGDAQTYNADIYPLASGQWTGGSY